MSQEAKEAFKESIKMRNRPVRSESGLRTPSLEGRLREADERLRSINHQRFGGESRSTTNECSMNG